MTRTLEFANRPGNQPAAEPRLHAANGLVIDRPRAWTMILNQSHWRSLAATYMVNLLVIVGAVTIGLNHESRPQALFDEGRAVTWLSAAQILAVGIASLAMFLKRRSTLVAGASGARSRWIWLLMAGGLALLAADEAFALHERADLAIHSALGWRENALTDRLDDIIILACGLAGVCTLQRFRAELRPFLSVMPLLVLAFSLFFAMVAMDLLSNRWSINPQHLPPAHTINTLTAWATITEESLKLLSEATFLVAFVSMLRMTRPHRRQMAASLGACAAEAHESRA